MHTFKIQSCSSHVLYNNRIWLFFVLFITAESKTNLLLSSFFFFTSVTCKTRKPAMNRLCVTRMWATCYLLKYLLMWFAWIKVMCLVWQNNLNWKSDQVFSVGFEYRDQFEGFGGKKTLLSGPWMNNTSWTTVPRAKNELPHSIGIIERIIRTMNYQLVTMQLSWLETFHPNIHMVFTNPSKH